jgi:hypothetical protein
MLVALHQDEVGAALVDWQTPLHMGVGVFAGAMGINPHVAAILFVGLRTLNLAAEEGLGHALFSTKHGQSHANEMADLMAEFVGLYVGGKARSMITGKAAAEGVGAAGMGGKIVGYQPIPGYYPPPAQPMWPPAP